MLKIPHHRENIHSVLITKNISTYIPKTLLVTKHLPLKATFVSKIRARGYFLLVGHFAEVLSSGVYNYKKV